MSRDVSQMAADLETAAILYAGQAVERVRSAAAEMASAAERMSSPLYGVAVEATVKETATGATVKITTRATDGIGTVFGGVRAADRAVVSKMDRIAEDNGLD